LFLHLDVADARTFLFGRNRHQQSFRATINYLLDRVTAEPKISMMLWVKVCLQTYHYATRDERFLRRPG
jgi:hypothetical protein